MLPSGSAPQRSVAAALPVTSPIKVKSQDGAILFNIVLVLNSGISRPVIRISLQANRVLLTHSLTQTHTQLLTRDRNSYIIYTQTHTLTQTQTQTQTLTLTLTLTLILTQTLTLTLTQTQTCTQARTHTRTHTCIFVCLI